MRTIAIQFICWSLLLTSSVARAQQVYPLYQDSIPGSILGEKQAEPPDMIVYLPERTAATGTAVIIFPGGAYGFLALKEEGTAIASAFVKKGIAAIVVRYRLPHKEIMREKQYGPLMDAQQAIRITRERSAEWGIDSQKVGVIGFSAGGHLAASAGTHFEKSYIPNPSDISLKPAFMILVYPVISMEASLTHMGSRINLLGVDPDTALVNLFSNERQVTADTPPAYITHTGDDQVVDVENAIAMYRALQQHHVPAELHLFPKGDHGFIQRLPAGEWIDPMLLFLKKQGF